LKIAGLMKLGRASMGAGMTLDLLLETLEGLGVDAEIREVTAGPGGGPGELLGPVATATQSRGAKCYSMTANLAGGSVMTAFLVISDICLDS